MIPLKKNPNALLTNYSSILTQIGLVLALFVVYQFLMIRSYPSDIKKINYSYVPENEMENTIEIKAPKPPPIENTAQPVIPDKIIKVDNQKDIIETVIESTETDENEAVEVKVDENIKNVQEEEEVIEDVPFVVIENVPVFPGCKGTNTQLRNCFSEKVTAFVSKKFNAELASDLGLEPGSIQRIFVVFKIDKKGNIVDIKARAPHKKLQAEAIRVVKLLPKMTPGKQRGKPVGVKYGLPIIFKVE
ncbi:MAG: energy transducer TonB [Lutibacter sp.]